MPIATTKHITLFLLTCVTILSSCVSFDKLQQKINSKPIGARYTGGHRDYVSLALYTDSTFFYVHAPHLMPAIQRRMKGWFIMDTTSVTLIAKRRWNHFWKRPQPATFRIRGNQLLMYSKEQENSGSGDFIKAYYTLTLEK